VQMSADGLLRQVVGLLMDIFSGRKSVDEARAAAAALGLQVDETESDAELAEIEKAEKEIDGASGR
jgi:hypothetical protein